MLDDPNDDDADDPNDDGDGVNESAICDLDEFSAIGGRAREHARRHFASCRSRMLENHDSERLGKTKQSKTSASPRQDAHCVSTGCSTSKTPIQICASCRGRMLENHDSARLISETHSKTSVSFRQDAQKLDDNFDYKHPVEAKRSLFCSMLSIWPRRNA